MTGIGPVAMRCPRRRRFGALPCFVDHSAALRAPLEELISILYLKGMEHPA
jgi:hypothetical protein